jgi:hypothetical protein
MCEQNHHVSAVEVRPAQRLHLNAARTGFAENLVETRNLRRRLDAGAGEDSTREFEKVKNLINERKFADLLKSIVFKVSEKSLRLKALRLAVLRRYVVQVEIELDDLQRCMLGLHS